MSWKIFFSYSKKYIRYKKNFFEGKTKNLISADEDVCARIRKYMAGELLSQYTLYAVHRSSDFKCIWKQTSIYANNWVIHEYFSTIMSLSKGKMKTLPVFYMSREPNFFVPINYTIRKHILNPRSNLNVAKILSKGLNLEVKNRKKLKMIFMNI